MDTDVTDAVSATTGADANNDGDNDPVVASYPIFLNPSLPAGRRLLVLQHPNRTDDHHHPRPPPTELRLKSQAGMVEVDIPVDSTTAYDRDKGLKWGRSLHNSTQAKSGGSHGIAGGFAVGAAQQRGGGRRRGEAAAAAAAAAEDADLLLDWNEAVRQGKTLTTQTLGGQNPVANDVQYMVGVFQGKNLHLTPVSSLVHIRPQLHHIDATTHLERQASSKEGVGAASGGGSGTGAGSGGARAIHMTIKTAVDGETVTTETMTDRLRAVQSEPWRKMRYTHENDDSAWDVYHESLFLQSKEEPGSDQQQQQTDEGETAQTQDLDLENLVPRFSKQWEDKQLLEAVSGIKKPEPKSADEEEAEARPDNKSKQKGKKPEPPALEAPKPKASGRTRGGGAAGTRRGGRAKAGSSKAGPSSINVD